MIYQLLKRDPAARWTPALTLASATLSALWHFLGAARTGPGVRVMPGLACVWLLIATSQAALEQQSRTRFQSSLPLSVRRIFAARALGMILLVWLPVIAFAAVLAGLRDLVTPAVGAFASICTLAMLGVQAASVRGFTIPRWLAAASVFLGVFITGLPLSEEFSRVAIPVSILCWIASGAVFLWTWHAVPKSFQIAPSKPLPAAAIRSTAARPFMPILRTLGPRGGIFLGVLFGQTMSSPILFGCIFVFFGWMGIRPGIRWLMALPIPRRALLSAVLIPVLLALTAGYLVGIHLPWYPRAGGVQIRLVSSQAPPWPYQRAEVTPCKMPSVQPPLDFWIPVSQGSAPLIRAPWGETFQPSTSRVLGFDIFNPYAVGCENSQRFFDWQFARATPAVYGRPLSRAAVDQFLTTVGTPLRIQIGNICVFAGAALVTLFLALLNDWRRLRRLSLTVRIAILLPLAGVPLVLVMLNPQQNFAQWLSWTLPGNLFVAIALPLAALCWGIDKLFREAEFVEKPRSPSAPA